MPYRMRLDFATQDAGNHTRQYRMRTSWKLPEMGDSVVVTILAKDHYRRIHVQYNPIALADSLFDLYNIMLAHEGSTEVMAQMARTKIYSSVDQQRYTRAGVAPCSVWSRLESKSTGSTLCCYLTTTSLTIGH